MNDDPLKGIPADRISQWEQIGLDAVEADLQNEHKGGRKLVKGPPGTGVQANRWVKYKRAQERAKNEQRPQDQAKIAQNPPKKPEVLELKPTFMGMSIDLKEVWSRVNDWWRARKQK